MEANLLRPALGRRIQVAQHGHSAPPLAAPQLGSCASSGRAWRLWAARHSQGRDRANWRPATASAARASRLQSRRIPRRWPFRWRKDSFYSCGEEGEPYHPAGFGPNATVGVGFDFEDSSIFFTLNGQFLGDAFEHADDSLDNSHRVGIHIPVGEGGLHAAVALHEPGDSARFNLGQERFASDTRPKASPEPRPWPWP